MDGNALILAEDLEWVEQHYPQIELLIFVTELDIYYKETQMFGWQRIVSYI